MWTANRPPVRPQRTPSVHSVASVYSNTSRPSSVVAQSPQHTIRQTSRHGGYDSDQSSDTLIEDEPANMQRQPSLLVNRMSQKFGGGPSPMPLKVQQSPMPPPLRTHMNPSPAPTMPLPVRPQVYPGPLRPAARSVSSEPQSHFGLGFVEIKPGEDLIYKDLAPQTHFGLGFVEIQPGDPIVYKDDGSSRAAAKPNLSGVPTHFNLGFVEIKPDEPKIYKDDTLSQASTVNGDDDQKTPTASSFRAAASGPLSAQLAAIMSKLASMEKKNLAISVTPQEYTAMTKKLKQLETEKADLQKRYEAMRRELEGLKSKPADASRSGGASPPASTNGGNGRTSPNRGRPGSMFMERRDTTDLFAVAKAAALQQRALELEKRNADLLSEIETLKQNSNSSHSNNKNSNASQIDEMNRVAAHQAWKDSVDRLEQKLKARDAEILRLRSGGAINTSQHQMPPSSHHHPAAAVSGGPNFQHVEMLHDEHAAYRERMGGKLQALRMEKESLQRDLHRREDQCHALEVKVSSLQRRVGVM